MNMTAQEVSRPPEALFFDSLFFGAIGGGFASIMGEIELFVLLKA